VEGIVSRLVKADFIERRHIAAASSSAIMVEVLQVNIMVVWCFQVVVRVMK
jgi:hypothetical protein